MLWRWSGVFQKLHMVGHEAVELLDVGCWHSSSTTRRSTEVSVPATLSDERKGKTKDSETVA